MQNLYINVLKEGGKPLFRKFTAIGSLVFVLLLLAGCSMERLDPEVNPITDNREGIWDKFFIGPLHDVIVFFAELFQKMGVDVWYYGLALVVVTILLRLLILPLMIQQTKSAKGMQAIQPELKKLREKYSAKDQKTQQKLQEETMKLFQESGVNPLAGCLPIFIQLPILLAFYQAIMRTAELKGQTFLWFTLSEADPFVLPLVAATTTFIQQKMIMVPDNPQMKVMLYVMPVMIFGFALYFPAALTLYWVVGNLFMIAQTHFITGPNAGKKKAQAETGQKAPQRKGKEGKNKGAGGKKK